MPGEFKARIPATKARVLFLSTIWTNYRFLAKSSDRLKRAPCRGAGELGRREEINGQG
jgi:hypothetical protein